MFSCWVPAQGSCMFCVLENECFISAMEVSPAPHTEMLHVSCVGTWVIFNMTPFLTAAHVGKQERKVKDQTPEAYLLCLMLWKCLLEEVLMQQCVCTWLVRENGLASPGLTVMWGQLRCGIGCPGRLCWLHLGVFVLPDWIKHRTAWSDLRAEPVLSRRLDLVTSWGPSLPEFSCDPIRLWAALQGEETNLPAALPVSVDGYQR